MGGRYRSGTGPKGALGTPSASAPPKPQAAPAGAAQAGGAGGLHTNLPATVPGQPATEVATAIDGVCDAVCFLAVFVSWGGILHLRDVYPTFHHDLEGLFASRPVPRCHKSTASAKDTQMCSSAVKSQLMLPQPEQRLQLNDLAKILRDDAAGNPAWLLRNFLPQISTAAVAAIASGGSPAIRRKCLIPTEAPKRTIRLLLRPRAAELGFCCSRARRTK